MTFLPDLRAKVVLRPPRHGRRYQELALWRWDNSPDFQLSNKDQTVTAAPSYGPRPVISKQGFKIYSGDQREAVALKPRRYHLLEYEIVKWQGYYAGTIIRSSPIH